MPLAVGISINPAEIEFTEVKQKVSYSVGFYPEGKNNRRKHPLAPGSIKWVSSNGKYSVSIPIAVVFL